jgi:hypothetical protein
MMSLSGSASLIRQGEQASLSNRALLVNDLFNVVLYGEIRRWARGRRMIGVRGCGLLEFVARPQLNYGNGLAHVRHGRVVRRAKSEQTRSAHCLTYVRASAVAARLKPSRFPRIRPNGETSRLQLDGYGFQPIIRENKL